MTLTPGTSAGFAPVVDEIIPGSTQTVTSTNQTIHSVTFTTPAGATKAMVTWSARLWCSNAPGGPYAVPIIKLDGTTVFPKGPITGNSFSVNTAVETAQQTNDEWHSSRMYISSLSAGSHTLVLTLSNNVGSTGTLAYDWSLLTIEFF